MDIGGPFTRITYESTLPGGNLITCEYGGNSDKIYNHEISTASEETVSILKPYTEKRRHWRAPALTAGYVGIDEANGDPCDVNWVGSDLDAVIDDSMLKAANV